MKANLHRFDILLDESVGMPVLNLLEAFLQCLFAPRYEGPKSQKSPRSGTAGFAGG